MKQTAIALLTAGAMIAQLHFLGLNGLTLVSLPLTIFLGLEAIEKATTKKTA